MKNTVHHILQSLTDEELKQFRYFITRKGNTGEREDLRLISQLRKEEKEVSRLSNANLQVKKRLKKQLEQFVTFYNIGYSAASELQSLVEMAKFLFRKNMSGHARSYLEKAERLAIRQEEYQLLDSIYDVEIAYLATIYVPDSYAQDINALLEKKEKNLELARTSGRINAAYALLIHTIRKALTQQMYADIDQLVTDTLNRFDLLHSVHTTPKMYCRMVNIVCWAFREKKEYEALKQYAISQYKKMHDDGTLEKVSLTSQMDLIDSIICATTRTSDYRHTEVFLRINLQNLSLLKPGSEEYINTEVITSAATCDLCLCTNRAKEAETLMEEMFRKYKHYQYSGLIVFVLRVNLLAAYFANARFDASVRAYNELTRQGQARFLKVGGLEMVLLTEIYGAISYYEAGDPDYAYELLVRIKRKYSDILHKPELSREHFFITILDKLINDPGYAGSRKFTADHDRFVATKEYLPADKEYISLNAWLTSKHTGRSYYECFLGLVNKS